MYSSYICRAPLCLVTRSSLHPHPHPHHFHPLLLHLCRTACASIYNFSVFLLIPVSSFALSLSRSSFAKTRGFQSRARVALSFLELGSALLRKEVAAQEASGTTHSPQLVTLTGYLLATHKSRRELLALALSRLKQSVTRSVAATRLDATRTSR